MDQLFGGVAADILYTSTKSKYSNTFTTVTGDLKTYSVSAGAQLAGQYPSNIPLNFCESLNWCHFVDSKLWVKPALNFSYSEEYLISKNYGSVTSMGSSIVYPTITMPQVIRLTAQQELLYEGKATRSGKQNFMNLTPSFACEKLRTTARRSECNLGIYSELGVKEQKGKMLTKLYFNYESLNLGPRHEYGIMFKNKF